jgi:hypothetical protein
MTNEINHFYGNRIGSIKFKCLRENHIHSNYLQLYRGKLETDCPECGRHYIMNDKNEFYSDRPLEVIELEIKNDILLKLLKKE